MYSDKHSLLFVSLFVLLGCAWGGSRETSLASIPPGDAAISAGDLVGDFAATTFLTPGEADGSVDVLAEGGRLTITFKPSGELSGHLYIPQASASAFSGADRDLTGTYTLTGDSLFLDVATLYSGPATLDRRRDTISFAMAGRGAPLGAELKRVE
jgi:hypothetical protein